MSRPYPELLRKTFGKSNPALWEQKNTRNVKDILLKIPQHFVTNWLNITFAQQRSKMLVLNLDTIDPSFQTWLIGDISGSHEINDNKIFIMVGPQLLVDRCFNVFNEHGCISLFWEIFYRCNSTVTYSRVYIASSKH